MREGLREVADEPAQLAGRTPPRADRGRSAARAAARTSRRPRRARRAGRGCRRTRRSRGRTRLRRAAGRRRRPSPRRGCSAGRSRRAGAPAALPRACRGRADRPPAGSRRSESSAARRRAASSRRTGRRSSAPRSKPRSSTSAWISSRIVAPALDRPLAVELLDRLHAAVHRHPGHHLRVREVAPRPAHLPDPLVRLAPALLEILEQLALEGPRVLVVLEPASAAHSCRRSSTSP